MSKNVNEISEVMLMINKISQENQLQTNKLITEHFGREIALLKDDNEKLKTEVELLKEYHIENKQNYYETKLRIDKVESKIDNFKNDDTGKFELYKATARARVHFLVGDKGSTKYLLFYSSFKSKIYSDIYNHFGVNNSGGIKMSDANTAIGMAKSWRPSMKYIHNKLKEFQRMESNGTLKEPRLSALNKFLDETNGGNNIEF